MLVFCDESWKRNTEGTMVGTLAAIAIPQSQYNAIGDRVFLLHQKYLGFESARKREIKGKRVFSPYEFSREAGGQVTMKLSLGRELLEELIAWPEPIRLFAAVVYTQDEVDLLCADPDKIDRPYLFLMERIHGYMTECGPDRWASVIFDDRGLGKNGRVAEAYVNFLTRSTLGRSFGTLLRSPLFTYSHASVGIQLADLACTVINRFHTARDASPRVSEFYNLARKMEWQAREVGDDGYRQHGFKVLSGQR